MGEGRAHLFFLLLISLVAQAVSPYAVLSSPPAPTPNSSTHSPPTPTLSPGVPIEIVPSGSKLTLSFPNGTILTFNLSSPPSFVTWDEANGTLRISTIHLPLGAYSIRWTNGSFEFILDRIGIELEKIKGKYRVKTFSELTGDPIKANVKVITPKGELNLTGEEKILKLPAGKYFVRIVAKKGNLSGELVKEVSVPGLWVDRELYFPGDTVKVMVSSLGQEPPKVILTLPDNRSINLTGFERSEDMETWILLMPLNSSVMLGKYFLSAGNETTYFYVDSYYINASYSKGVVRGSVTYNFLPPEEVEYEFSSGRNGSVKIVNGSFSLSIPEGEEYVVLSCGNAQITLMLEEKFSQMRIWVDKELHFPGEVVSIWVRFPQPPSVTITYPDNRSVNLTGFKEDKSFWRTDFPLNSSVMLGKYLLSMGNETAYFFVDFYELNASLSGDLVKGNVTYNFVSPKEVSYKFSSGRNGSVKIVNGSFSLPVFEKERYVVLVCGNAKLELPLEKRVEVDPIYFPGETVIIDSSFQPKSAIIVDPANRTFRLKFERVGDRWKSSFSLNSSVVLGGYVLFMDDINMTFFVDSYSFDLSYKGKGILGKVVYDVLGPSNLSYEVEGVNGTVDVVNDTFLIPVSLQPGNHSVVLYVWGREFKLNLTVPAGSDMEITTQKLSKLLATERLSELPGLPLEAYKAIDLETGYIVECVRYNLTSMVRIATLLNISKGLGFMKVKVDGLELHAAEEVKLEGSALASGNLTPGVHILEFWYPIKAESPPYEVLEEPTEGGRRIKVKLSEKPGGWIRLAVDLKPNETVVRISRGDGKVIFERDDAKTVGWAVLWRWGVAFYDDPAQTYIIDVSTPDVIIYAKIVGRIFEDYWPLGKGFGTEDQPIAGAKVGLFLDNGDGEFNPLTDILVDVTQTDLSGAYSFSVSTNGIYWVVVDSKTLKSFRGLNSGHSWDETWAEGTFVVSWNGFAHAGSPDFGGKDPKVSDSCSLNVIFYDGFETWEGWTDYKQGEVTQSSEQVYKGSYSLKKSSNNDPDGGYKLLGQTIGRGVILQGYVYRPSGFPPGNELDAIGLVDSNFDGYTLRVDHKPNGGIAIDMRKNGNRNQVSDFINFDPPEDKWYFWKLVFFENYTIAFQVYDLSGNLLKEVRATDGTYLSFDRVIVQGGSPYYVDELMLWRPGTRCEHVAEVNVANYKGEYIDFGFSFDVVVNTLDTDHDSLALRYAQGSLRQFIANANAISGYDRSYFVMMVDPNVEYATGHSWRITLNSSLGAWPTFKDGEGAVLNGTVFNPDLTVRDDNPGTAGSMGKVGTGPDGIINTGDECSLPGVNKPEIELYGNGFGGNGIVIEASNTWVYGLSIFGFYAGASVGGPIDNVSISGVMSGLTSSGEDPYPGLKRNEGYGLLVHEVPGGSQISISDSLFAYNGLSGIRYNNTGVLNSEIYRVESFSNGQVYNWGDGVDVYSSGGVRIVCSYIHDNAAHGVDNWYGLGPVAVVNTNVSSNGLNNNLEDAGIVISANNSLVNASIIHGNTGPGVVIANWANGSRVSLNNSVLINSIFSNGEVGIDIDLGYVIGDNVTLNDGVLNSNQPNRGIDYPIISYFNYDSSTKSLLIAGYINREDAYEGSSNFAGANVLIYLVKNSKGGDNGVGNNYAGNTQLDKSYGEGWVYLGSLTADSKGEFYGTLDLSRLPSWAMPDLGSTLTAVTYIKDIGTSEFGPSVPWRPINVSVNKSIGPYGDCAVQVTLEAKNRNPWPIFARVYDVVPQGMNMISSNPSPDGSSGRVYWWRMILAPAGTPKSTKTVTYIIQAESCGITDFNLSDAQIVGIDPPSSGPKPKIEIKEYIEAIFHYNGSYEIKDHFGFLTASNPTSDFVEDLEIYLSAPGYIFYPDYPAPSSTPESPPLKADRIDPGHYVRWRFNGPLNVTPPITMSESLSPSTASYGERSMVTLTVRIKASEPLDNATYVKPLNWIDLSEATPSKGRVEASGEELFWIIGPMSEGETVTLVIRGQVSCTSSIIELPDAKVSTSSSSPPLLHNISKVLFSGRASVSVEKERANDHYDLKASFSNEAVDLIYNLTRICVYEEEPRSPTSRLVFCEGPNTILRPAVSWTSQTYSDTPDHEPPKYFVVANFTGVAEVVGSYGLVSPLPGGDYESSASVREPALTCVGAPTETTTIMTTTATRTTFTTVTTTTTERTIPPLTTTTATTSTVTETATTTITTTTPIKTIANVSLAKACEPQRVEVGDLVECRITVSNEGNATASNLLVYDVSPSGLDVKDAGDGKLSKNEVVWKIPKLDPGGIVQLSIVLRALREGNFTNLAHLNNLTASAPVVVVKGEPGIKLQKLGIYLGRGDLRYLIRVVGPSGIEVVDELPEGVELIEVESSQRISWKQEQGGRIIRIRAENGSALVNLTVHYPSWPLGGDLTNWAYIPNVTRVKVKLSIRPLSKGEMVGILAAPFPLLLVLLLLRRRKAKLLDYWTFREMLLSGINPTRGHAITEATLHRVFEDPILAPIAKELLHHHGLRVTGIGEEPAVRALELARRAGMHVRDAAEALLVLGEVGPSVEVIV